MEQMPVFVKIIEPEEIRKLIVFLREKIDDANSTLDKIQSLSEEESMKIAEWQENFSFVNSQIDTTKNILLEPERI